MFIYISIGIIQNLIAQIFKANGTNDYCFNLKRKQILQNVQTYKNLKRFEKSRSNSTNKAEKQMFETKIVIEIKLQLTGNGL